MANNQIDKIEALAKQAKETSAFQPAKRIELIEKAFEQALLVIRDQDARISSLEAEMQVNV